MLVLIFFRRRSLAVQVVKRTLTVVAILLFLGAASQAVEDQHPCGNGPVDLVVYQAMWCEPCIKLHEILPVFREKYGIHVTEYIVQDKRGKVVDRKRMAELNMLFRKSRRTHYPYKMVCGVELTLDMSWEYKEWLLRIPTHKQ